MATAIFMMGGPASGKSTIRKREFGDIENVLDCDDIKATHPDYDPNNPGALHAWSAAELVKAFHKVVATGEDFVYDGTGSTAERYVNYMNMASASGYTVILCYVKTPLRVALERNAARERTVAEHVVREKYNLIATSFDIVSPFADTIKVFTN